VSSVKMASKRCIEVTQSVSKQGATRWTSSVVDKNMDCTTLREKKWERGLKSGLVFEIQDKACMFTCTKGRQLIT
jgi:predicted metal-binding protein